MTQSWETRTLQAHDGVAVRAGIFSPSEPSYDCVLLPGLSDFLEKRTPVAAALAASGHRVVSLDWRGQGRSQRLGSHPHAAHVDDYDDLVRDVDRVLDWAGIGTRRIWCIGYSMGATTALMWRERYDDPVPTALVSPMLALPLPMTEGVVLTLAKVASALGRRRHFASGETSSDPGEWEFEGNTITQDRAAFDELKALLERSSDAFTSGTSWGWVAASLKAMRQVRLQDTNPTNLKLFAAEEDRSVDTSAIAKFIQRTGIEANWYSGGHDLFLSDEETSKRLLQDLIGFAKDALARA